MRITGSVHYSPKVEALPVKKAIAAPSSRNAVSSQSDVSKAYYKMPEDEIEYPMKSLSSSKKKGWFKRGWKNLKNVLRRWMRIVFREKELENEFYSSQHEVQTPRTKEFYNCSK